MRTRAPLFVVNEWSGDGTSNSKAIELGNRAELQITGDQTIAMWLKPAALGAEMSPLTKCYGGEFSITVEEDGHVSYFYGTAGSRAEPYQRFRSGFVLSQNSWTHIAVVRDLKARKLVWYVNGKQDNEESAQYGAAEISSLSVIVGRAWAH